MMLLAKSVRERLERAVLLCVHETLPSRWTALVGVLVSVGSLEILALVSISASMTYVQVATDIVSDSATDTVATAPVRRTSK
jgi:hypothetical protein